MVQRQLPSGAGKGLSTIEARSCPPPRGESLKMVDKRVLSFIKDLMNLIKTGRANVAISAHGNSMRPFRRYFEHLTVREMIELENPHDNYFDYVVKFADRIEALQAL